jgi:hypothetical protein
MTPVSRSMYDQRRPRASPWRMPSARATDQRAPFLFLAATPRMRRASPRVKGSISCDAAEGASTRAATFRVIRRRPSAGSEDYRARSVGFWLQPAQRAIDFAHQERHRSAAALPAPRSALVARSRGRAARLPTCLLFCRGIGNACGAGSSSSAWHGPARGHRVYAAFGAASRSAVAEH